MKALAIHSTNPLVIEDGMKSHVLTRPTTIKYQAEAFAGGGEFELPTICLLNNKPILRKEWNYKISNLDTVVFVTVPQGGAGRKILTTIAFIALIIIAPHLAPAFGSFFTAATGISISLATATALVITLGGILINVLLPPPAPPSADQASSASRSPTYSLTSQGNTARLGESIPCLYGRHLIYPDFASTPYTEYNDDNEQVLFALLVIGQGYYDLEQVRIEDTPIDNFQEVEWEKIEPGGTTTLVHLNVITVVEVAGQELIHEEDEEAEFFGPFVINPSDTLTNQIGVDVVFPRGLYRATSDGDTENYTVGILVEVRRIDINGDAIGVWQTIVEHTFTENSLDVLRRTFTVQVVASRYEIRAQRTTEKPDSPSLPIASEITITAIRAYLTNAIDFGNITMLAVRARATNNLNNQNSRKINVIAQRHLNTWDPVNGWSTERTATRSIAWAIADICRAEYGGELTDDKIDLNGLYDLDRIWADREDTLDGVFDRRQTIWECLTLASRAGRALPIIRAGIISFIRDQQTTGYSAMFSSRNIVKDSFSIDYIMPNSDLADKLELSFLNESTWKPDVVNIQDTLGRDEAVTAKIMTFGMTNKEQVEREGIYLARVQRYRRKMITFRTELEGWIPNYGSPILVSYDVTNWGQAGDIVWVSFGNYTTSIDLTWKDGQQHYVIFRKRDGSGSAAFAVTRGTDSKSFHLEEDIGMPLDISEFRVKTQFTFGVSEEYGIKAKIAAIKPRGDLTVEIEAVEEHDEIHAPEVLSMEAPVEVITRRYPLNVGNVDLFRDFGYPSEPIRGRVEIYNTSFVFSLIPEVPAISIVGFHPSSVITIVNRGTIIGAGGIGGLNMVGGNGGHAIDTSIPILIENYGVISGGGGAGGGGTTGRYTVCNTVNVPKEGQRTVCETRNYYPGTGGNGAGAVIDTNFEVIPFHEVQVTVAQPTQGTESGGNGGALGQDGSDAAGAGAKQGGDAGLAIKTRGNGISFITNPGTGTFNGGVGV